MGVKNLWHILSSTAEKVDLRETCGSRVAIDLSGWIVENAKVTPGLAKSHLRNLFFRCAALSSLGIIPVFVADARKAPALKSATLATRRGDEIPEKPVNLERKRLRSLIKECKEMIDALGFPFVESPGEAEGFCVQMNLDAVVTEDSDVFCYGSNIIVWRNFSITGGKSFSVERYDSKKIERLLGLSRDRMLMLSILLGCDYFPSGVPGVGKETVMNLFNLWPKEWDVLEILNNWISFSFNTLDSFCFKNECSQRNKCCSNCCITSGPCRCSTLMNTPEMAKLECSLMKKCQKVDPLFWTTTYSSILREFLSFDCLSENNNPSIIKRNAPDLCTLVPLLVKKLCWEESYSFQKSLPILTRWQISEPSNKLVAELKNIVKKRSVDGIPSLEVEWNFVDSHMNHRFGNETAITIEPFELLQKLDNESVEIFLSSIKKKKKTTKGAPKSTRLLVKTNHKQSIIPQGDDLESIIVHNPKADSQYQITQFYKKLETEKVEEDLCKKEEVFNMAAKILKLDDSYNNTNASNINSICNSLNDCSLYDSGEDNDLSLIIDEILSKKSSNKTLLTSTPTLIKSIGVKTKMGINIRGVNTENPNEDIIHNESFSVEPFQNTNDKEKTDEDSLQDSFDRMCNPVVWKK
ncbi:flap endonuclease GEN [Lepeophtheirus salmonis]|uniref:flap endonuclease GEN n=1 Tax=Lepeophtheirus salmonis TaxID=72036 RepID=UPI001AEACAC1|nr:flap endonuclease GEN-like [Lepeophtheirus salmonis]